MAKEVNGHTKVCSKHGQYIDSGRGCVVCEGAQHGGPHPDPHSKARYARELEAGLIDDRDYEEGYN